MKIKVSEATNTQLDWLVAKCEGRDIRPGRWRGKFSSNGGVWMPTENWSQGGPIIERERTCIDIGHDGVWLAYSKQNYDDEKEFMHSGPTPLVAAMRCYASSKLGDEVEVPDELGGAA